MVTALALVDPPGPQSPALGISECAGGIKVRFVLDLVAQVLLNDLGLGCHVNPR